MDAIQYFLINSGLLFALIGLIAFLLGLLLGYLLWGKLRVELDSTRSDLNECITRRRELQESLRAAERSKASAAEPVSKAMVTAGSHDYYSRYIQDGGVRHDSLYGFVYNRRPELADDLIEIKGVGEAMNEKLNEFGVYTFRQIAGWDADMAGRFAERLESFQDRVLRDDWIGQAKQLHFEKYQERL